MISQQNSGITSPTLNYLKDDFDQSQLHLQGYTQDKAINQCIKTLESKTMDLENEIQCIARNCRKNEEKS